jgi:hypothetical protein
MKSFRAISDVRNAMLFFENFVHQISSAWVAQYSWKTRVRFQEGADIFLFAAVSHRLCDPSILPSYRGGRFPEEKHVHLVPRLRICEAILPVLCPRSDVELSTSSALPPTATP